MTYDNPRGDLAVCISVVFTVIADLVVLLRLWARLVIVRRPGFEDLSIFVAMLLCTANTILTKVMVVHGLGLHIWLLVGDDITNFLKALYAYTICYSLAIGFTKLSFLFLYYRLFYVSRGARWAINIVSSFVALFTTENILMNFFLCVPLTKFWVPTTPGTCIATSGALWIINTTFDIVTDLAIFLLPIPILKHINLPRRRKYGLILVFTLGFLSCIINVVRLHTVIILTKKSDTTYYNTNETMWGNIVLNIGMICACLPPLHSIFARCFQAIFVISTDTPIDNNRRPYLRRRQPQGAVTNTSGQTGSSDTRKALSNTNSTKAKSKDGDDETISMNTLQIQCCGETSTKQLGQVPEDTTVMDGQIVVVKDVYRSVMRQAGNDTSASRGIVESASWQPPDEWLSQTQKDRG